MVAETNQPQKENLRQVLIGEVILLGAISFYGYCVSVAYEAGYNNYFSIPKYFIPFDIVSILYSLATTLGLVISFSSVIRIFGWLGLTKRNSVFQKKLSACLIATIIILYGLYLIMPPLKIWLIVIGCIGILAFLFLGLPLIGKPKKLTYEEQYVSYARSQLGWDKRDPIFWLQDKLEESLPGAVGLLILLLVYLVFSFFAGYYSAKSTTVFETISTTPPMVVLQYSNGTFIVSPYASSTHKLSGRLFLMGIDQVSQGGYYLSQQQLGSFSQ